MHPSKAEKIKHMRAPDANSRRKTRLLKVEAVNRANMREKTNLGLVRSVEVFDEGRHSTIRVWSMPSLREVKTVAAEVA